MILNNVRKFDPFWLHSLPENQRDEVVMWLSGYVNVNHCAYFQYDGKQVKAAMYEVDNHTGQPIMRSGGEVVWDEPKIFTPTSVPSIVQQFFEEGA